jgi:hypothetical protein
MVVLFITVGIICDDSADKCRVYTLANSMVQSIQTVSYYSLNKTIVLFTPFLLISDALCSLIFLNKYDIFRGEILSSLQRGIRQNERRKRVKESVDRISFS